MDQNSATLPDSVRAVRGLGLDRGVPPAVEVYDVGGLDQVEAKAAGPEREYERRRPFALREALDLAFALGGG